MRTKVLSLNVDRSMSFSRFQARIESSINNFTDDCVFQQFEDIREMFVALQGALGDDGLVITEYEPNIEPASNRFLERNRIVSGLSIGTLVVEGGHRSGTSITARLTREQGKNVFCVP